MFEPGVDLRIEDLGVSEFRPILGVALGEGRFVTALVAHEEELDERALQPLDLDAQTAQLHALGSAEILASHHEKSFP